MSIEIGTVCEFLVWRKVDEKWIDDCVGVETKQGSTVMCWGMIGYNHKWPFHIWVPETKERGKAEAETVQLNADFATQEKELDDN